MPERSSPGEVKTRCWQRSPCSGCQSSAAAARRVGQGGEPGSRAFDAQCAARRLPGEQGVGPVGEPEAAPAAGGSAAQVLKGLIETLGMEGAGAVPDECGDARFVGLLGQQCAGRVLGRGRRLHVETGEGQLGEFSRVRVHPAGGGVQLAQQRMVVPVRVRAVHEGEDGGVLQLPGPGVADGALVLRGRRESRLGQVVAVGEVGQGQGRVHRGDHVAQGEEISAVRRDDLRHRLGLDRVPQFDDGQPGRTVARQELQLRYEVLAQCAAGAVVDQRCLTRAEHAGRVADQPSYGSLAGGGEVVVQGDAARYRPQETVDHVAAGVGVQTRDDDHREPPVLAHHRSPARP
jgi:hypothetical protein